MKTRKIYLIVIILIGILSLTSVVQATTQFNLKLESSKTSYKAGEKVIVSLVLDGVTSVDGVAAYQAKMLYDKNVLTLENIISDKWEITENEGNIVANTKDGIGITNRTTVATIEFKVNSGANEGNTEVKIDVLAGSNGTTIEGLGSTLKLTVVKETTDDNETNNNQTNNNETNNNETNNNETNNNETNNNETNNNQTNNNQTNKIQTGAANNISSSTTANKTLPYAGYIYIIPGIIVSILGISTYFYFKYKRMSGI